MLIPQDLLPFSRHTNTIWKLIWYFLNSVDASSELKARGVKSGDKVLEVNDIVVTDDTLDKVKLHVLHKETNFVFKTKGFNTSVYLFIN